MGSRPRRSEAARLAADPVVQKRHGWQPLPRQQPNEDDTEVELHQAFMWDCPECGRENFERAVEQEMPEEMKREILEALGDDPDLPIAGGFLLVAPTNVTCKHCGWWYDVEIPLVPIPGMPGGDEDDDS